MDAIHTQTVEKTGTKNPHVNPKSDAANDAGPAPKLPNKSNIEAQVSDGESDDDEEEDFYTPGSPLLYHARIDILKSSLSSASQRLDVARTVFRNQDFDATLQFRRRLAARLAGYEFVGSQIITKATRAISTVRFCADSTRIACGSWDGSVHILDAENLNPVLSGMPGTHSEKVGGLDWDLDHRIITGGGEGNLAVWDCREPLLKPIVLVKQAHRLRITRTLFHPHRRYAISTSFDYTWKLWDLERPQKELYEQEGHSKEVFAGSVHPDGSLFVSGGLDGVGRVWDLRCGRVISTVAKHARGIYSTDWSPNGYHFATGSGDNTVKIWDMRMLRGQDRELFTIPAHTKLVSDVRFFRGKHVASEEGSSDCSGTFMISSSYDGHVSVWSADNWTRIKTLEAGGDRVMSCDIDGHGVIVSAGWDRSLRLWKV